MIGTGNMAAAGTVYKEVERKVATLENELFIIITSSNNNVKYRVKYLRKYKYFHLLISGKYQPKCFNKNCSLWWFLFNFRYFLRNLCFY